MDCTYRNRPSNIEDYLMPKKASKNRSLADVCNWKKCPSENLCVTYSVDGTQRGLCEQHWEKFCDMTDGTDAQKIKAYDAIGLRHDNGKIKKDESKE